MADETVNDTTDNMADRQRGERAGFAEPAGSDAPLIPDPERPQQPAGATPPGGAAPSPQDLMRDEQRAREEKGKQ